MPCSADRQQPVLAQAVREELRDVRREQVARLVAVEPRRDRERRPGLRDTAPAPAVLPRRSPRPRTAAPRAASRSPRAARRRGRRRGTRPRFAASIAPGPSPADDEDPARASIRAVSAVARNHGSSRAIEWPPMIATIRRSIRASSVSPTRSPSASSIAWSCSRCAQRLEDVRDEPGGVSVAIDGLVAAGQLLDVVQRRAVRVVRQVGEAAEHERPAGHQRSLDLGAREAAAEERRAGDVDAREVERRLLQVQGPARRRGQRPVCGELGEVVDLGDDVAGASSGAGASREPTPPVPAPRRPRLVGREAARASSAGARARWPRRQPGVLGVREPKLTTRVSSRR
jgi:hypothetical protein